MKDLLVTYLRPHRKALGVIAVLLLIQAITNLYLPNLNADIINYGVLTGDTAYILRVGGLMLLVSILLGVASVITVYYSARTSMRFGREVRGDLFRHVEGFSLSQMHAFGVPSLITRNTNDVQQLQMLVMVGLTMMVLAPKWLAGFSGKYVDMHGYQQFFVATALLGVPVLLLVALASRVKTVRPA